MNVPLCTLLVFAMLWSEAMAVEAPDTSHQAKHPFAVGVDANFSLDLAGKATAWKVGDEKVDLFEALHAAGADSFRVRVWTGDTGPYGRDYACTVAKRAQEAGLRPHLVFFLSEQWADYVKQPAPAEWAKLPFSDKLAKVSTYSERTARHFRQAGVETDLYAIGNEIDFGICGEFEEKWERRFYIPYMNDRIWNKAAEVILAAEQGIKRANPKARFMLHLTQWWNPGFCTAFLDAMRRHGVQVDTLGLSFYPSSGLSEKNTFADLGANVRKVVGDSALPVIICEAAYPSLPSFGGQFATWNKAVDGYPLSEAGQRKWIADFFAFCWSQQDIRGAFYWSPEWYTEEMWRAFALFRADGTAKEGLDAFRVDGGLPSRGRRYRHAQETLHEKELELERERTKLAEAIAAREKAEMEVEQVRSELREAQSDKQRLLREVEQKASALEEIRREEAERRRAVRFLEDRLRELNVKH